MLPLYIALRLPTTTADQIKPTFILSFSKTITSMSSRRLDSAMALPLMGQYVEQSEDNVSRSAMHLEPLLTQYLRRWLALKHRNSLRLSHHAIPCLLNFYPMDTHGNSQIIQPRTHYISHPAMALWDQRIWTVNHFYQSQPCLNCQLQSRPLSRPQPDHHLGSELLICQIHWAWNF